MKKAFTLIELLIVVAIIAILAAIAVPNFLEAQTRAKVSRAKADMRTVATGLESYYIDNNKYPTDRPVRPLQGNFGGTETIGDELTSPIAYLSSLAITNDVFKQGRSDLLNTDFRRRINYRNTLLLSQQLITGPTYVPHVDKREGAWRMCSAGPDRYTFNNTLGTGILDYMDFNFTINYDPTNGTVSLGDVFRTAKFSDRISEPGDWNRP